MKRIIITVPKKDEKWKLSGLGTRAKQYKSAQSLFNSLERRFFERVKRDKYVCRVNYVDGVNESIASNSSSYLLHSAGCFLEDYLAKRTMNRINKQYSQQ